MASIDRTKCRSWKTKACGVLAISQYTEEVATHERLAAMGQYYAQLGAQHGNYPLNQIGYMTAMQTQQQMQLQHAFAMQAQEQARQRWFWPFG